MKRKALIALIISSCVVVVGCVGLVFWALAATQVTVKSSLVVSYKPTPQVVCETSATYQKTTDATATPFQTANLEFVYGGPDTTRNIEASSDALELDDTDTYLVTEYTFTNKNLMDTYDLTIRLTDNAICTNMARKYYFGNDIAELSVSAKKDKIINSGVDNLSLSTQKLVLGYQETGRIYMLLQITPGIVANYTSDSTNLFIFNMTCAERGTEEAYLTRNWISRIGDNTSLNTVTTSIIFTKDSSQISGLSNSVSVGTNSETDTSAFVPADGREDVTAYWGSDKSTIVIYSPVSIYAPQNCSYLFTVGLSSSSSNSISKLTNLDLTNFDTSNVTSMYYMFNYCSSLTSLTFGSNFDTTNVTDMRYMFNYCSSLTSLDVSSFNTSKVTKMYHMFDHCSSLTSLDVSNFDTSNVIDMMYMFYNCRSLTSLDVSNFNTSNVTDMMYMFSDCRSLTSLDVSNFDTSNVIDMADMFYYCTSLTSLDVSNFDTSNVTNMASMFNNCKSLTSLDVSHFDTSKVTDMGSMFSSCSSLTSLDVSNFNTSNVTGMGSMFSGCSKLTSLDVSNFDTSKVTIMPWMFSYCSSLTSLDVSNFNTSNVTNMSYMFYNCISLTSLDLSNFNTSKVKDMEEMFDSCTSLTSLDVSSFDTSNVTTMLGMFYSCSSLTSLDVSNFDTSKVEDMQQMFNSCSSLTSLDVSNFDTSKVTDMASMFKNCSTLTSLNLGNFNLTSCTAFTRMLSGCSALASITLPYNLRSGKTITLPTSTYYKGSAGPYDTIGTATSRTTVACSTASSKVTLTKAS